MGAGFRCSGLVAEVKGIMEWTSLRGWCGWVCFGLRLILSDSIRFATQYVLYIAHLGIPSGLDKRIKKPARRNRCSLAKNSLVLALGTEVSSEALAETA